ncbi:MAG: SDR family NAD(P)-dependent oxidoreductase [Bacteroidia bacterium]
MGKIVLITGATAGIGKATAIKFASNKYDVVITGRRKERLEELKNNLQKNYGVEVIHLCFDVRNKEEVTTALNSLTEEWKKIDVLVNNSGLAQGLSTIQEGDINDWDTMIDTNVKGLLYVSRPIMNWMVKRNSGHIINISSIAGKDVYKKGNIYCSTKHAVEAITKSMRIDMLEHGVKVTSVAPGAVDTEFSLVRYKGDKEKAEKVYAGFKPLLADDIAENIFWVASQPAHVNIDEITITPLTQANAIYIVKEEIK